MSRLILLSALIWVECDTNNFLKQMEAIRAIVEMQRRKDPNLKFTQEELNEVVRQQEKKVRVP